MAKENFRSALHGFNRTDVVQFIQKQTAEHEKALRRYKDETEQLQTELDSTRKELDAANAALESANAALAAAQEELEEYKTAQPAQEASAVSVVTPPPINLDEMELAAYRRAELTERMARERAAASAERMRTIFAQTEAKLASASLDVQTLFDAFRNDFEQLQQLLLHTQGIVDESSAGLKASESLCVES